MSYLTAVKNYRGIIKVFASAVVAAAAAGAVLLMLLTRRLYRQCCLQ